MKKLLKFVVIAILIVVLAASGLIGWLSAVEYRPEPVAALELSGEAEGQLSTESGTLRILSWNIGYAGLGKNEDFFMDGGKLNRPKDAASVEGYLGGIRETVDALGAELMLLQEVDENSHRSYGIDETAVLRQGCSAYAYNYSCPFVPVP